MKNKDTMLGGLFLLIIIVWLFKYLMLLGALVSLGAIIYYVVKATKNSNNRKTLLLQRVLPAFVLLLICSGIYGAMSGNSETVSQSASSAKASSSSNDNEEKSSSSEDESSSDSEDDELSDSEGDSVDTSSSESNDDYSTNDKDNSTATSNDDANTTKGDMETDQQGTIVGNSRTMVYHTPDQQGYRMNSANAVYFNTEAEAQAAGYRKSAR